MAYTLNTHYTVDADAGIVTIVALPGSADTTLKVTYDTTLVQNTTMLDGPENTEYYLFYRAINKGNVDKLVGWEWYRTKLTPTKNAALLGNTYAEFEIEVELYADRDRATDPDFGSYGRVIFIDDAE